MLLSESDRTSPSVVRGTRLRPGDSLAAIASRQGVTDRYVARLIRLAFLGPKIVEAIAERGELADLKLTPHIDQPRAALCHVHLARISRRHHRARAPSSLRERLNYPSVTNGGIALRYPVRILRKCEGGY
jgi:hypothetical protein